MTADSTPRGQPVKQPNQARWGNVSAVKHGRYSKRTPGERDVAPQLRRLIARHPHLADAPMGPLIAYVHTCGLLERMGSHAAAEDNLLTDDGEPRKAVESVRRLSAEVRALAGVLGLTSDGTTGPPSMAEQVQALQRGGQP